MARSLAQNPDRQNRLLLMGALGLAVLAALFAFVSLRGFGEGDGGGSRAGDVSVVVTTQSIGAGARIDAGMLELASVPPDTMIENALVSLGGLDGSIARYPLERGEQVTAAKLGQRDDDDGTLSDVVPRGKRAVTVEVTEQTIFGGLLVAGDHVDVIAVVEAQSDEGLPRAIQIVQNAEVLSVADESLRATARLDKDGNPIESDTADGPIAQGPDDLDSQPDATSVTLAVSPGDALLIALAQEQWTLDLSLRGTGDEDILDIPPQILNPGE